MDDSAYHQQGYVASAQPQQQVYDPSAQPQQFYNHQSTEDYYSYAYSNPNYVNNQQYPYDTVNVQPPQNHEQEPNPPGVTVQPAPHQDPNAYYQSIDYGAAAAATYTLGPHQGELDAGVAVAHQSIVQSSYQDTGTINGMAPPPGGAQTHIGLIPNYLGRAYYGRGRGRGHGRGRSLHKRGPTPAQDQTIFAQGGSSHVRVEPPRATTQSYEPTFGPTQMPFQGQAQPAQVLPTSKHFHCELCKVECNSIEILNLHKNGKKHMKKLKSFESQNVNNMAAIGGQIEQPSVVESKLEVHFQPTDQIEASAYQQLQQESLPSQDINEESKVGVKKEKVGEVKKALWCELCKADCNSVEIFNKHLNGKKHQKKLKIFGESQNLNKSRQLESSENQQLEQGGLPSADNNNEENRVAVGKQKVEKLGTTEESGKNVMVDSSEGVERGFKRKMRGGKVCRNMKKRPMEPPRPKEVIPLLCELCNLKCESQVVFQTHLVGKKHLSNAQRFLSENEALGQEVFQILRHAIQTVHEQNVYTLTSHVASQLNHHGLLAQASDFQASTLETNISQPQLLPTNFSGPIITNSEGIPAEGRPENEGMNDFETDRLVLNKMEIVATDDKAVTAETI